MQKIGLRSGIVTFPISRKGIVPMENLTHILSDLSDTLWVISDRLERSSKTEDIFSRVRKYAYIQARIAWRIIRLSRRVDFWFFFIGGEGLILPVLCAKILGKEVIIVSTGSGVKIAQVRKDSLAKVLVILQNITYCLADRIILYSERLIEQLGLWRYQHKVLIAPRHFLDFALFKETRRFIERGDVVGYIGSLSKIKGVPNLFQAIPMVLEERGDFRFLVIGDGAVGRESLRGEVEFVGWVSHAELPDYLNRLKLLVLPSYTEGLQNIILEAMACGTPVLATAVGAIRDVVKEGATGFIMEDNSPESIAKNIIRVLKHPSLEKIAHNGRQVVEQEYTYAKAVERYRGILEAIKR